MAESKPDWKKEIAMIVQNEMVPINKKIEDLSQLLSHPPSSETAKPSEHPVHTIEDLLNCPDCYPKIKSAVINKEFKDAKFECEECGLPVKKEESAKTDWVCPNCNNQYAKPKD